MKELKGFISFTPDPQGLTALCKKHIAGFDPERFEIVAIRLYSGAEYVLTIYAADKLDNGSQVHEGKFPVKKFKLSTVTPAELFEMTGAFNFTVSNGAYDISDMEVTNK
jgi:hypothetical protein